jgi:membrane-bound serine protease (ClpP class)
MQFLLDPNVAYLLLLAGVLFTVLAIASPGTGFVEIAAFFCLAAAAYAVYNLSVNWWALLLLGVSAIPFVFAIQKPKREALLGLSILGFIAGSVFLFSSEDNFLAVNPLVAAVASALAAVFVWVAARKSMQAMHSRPRHDLQTLVGLTGESKSQVHEEGSVQVAGELWSARSDSPIPSGAPVRVVARDGFVLVVEKSESSKS